MRTTLTIDDDVAAGLERLRKSQDISLKRLINEALRRGLREIAEVPAMEHGLVLCSAHHDFACVPGLRWLNPLTSQQVNPSGRR